MRTNIPCEICGQICKNENGLRMHMKKHFNEKKPEDTVIMNETNKVIDEVVYKEVEDKFVIPAVYNIELFLGGVSIVEYPVIGEKAFEEAKAHAIKKGYDIKYNKK